MGYREPFVPPRVRAAIETLEHFRYIEDSCDIHKRSLSKPEESVRSSALQVLRLYLTGEMDYGDVPPAPPAKTDEDDGPRVPAPV